MNEYSLAKVQFSNINKESAENNAKINIERDVWIDKNVIILKGITIGRGSVIGKNTVIVSDIPPYSYAVGVPAKVKRFRFATVFR